MATWLLLLICSLRSSGYFYSDAGSFADRELWARILLHCRDVAHTLSRAILLNRVTCRKDACMPSLRSALASMCYDDDNRCSLQVVAAQRFKQNRYDVAIGKLESPAPSKT
jgi:hypothetical protein